MHHGNRMQVDREATAAGPETRAGSFSTADSTRVVSCVLMSRSSDTKARLDVLGNPVFSASQKL